jgi:hypothetical protein
MILVWPLQGITVGRPPTGETVSAGKILIFIVEAWPRPENPPKES